MSTATTKRRSARIKKQQQVSEQENDIESGLEAFTNKLRKTQEKDYAQQQDMVQIKGDPNHEYFDGDIVWAKFQDFPWWPGQIEINSNKMRKKNKKLKKTINVRWFGDYEETNKCELLNVIPWNLSVGDRISVEVEEEDFESFKDSMNNANITYLQRCEEQNTNNKNEKRASKRTYKRSLRSAKNKKISPRNVSEAMNGNDEESSGGDNEEKKNDMQIDHGEQEEEDDSIDNLDRCANNAFEMCNVNYCTEEYMSFVGLFHYGLQAYSDGSITVGTLLHLNENQALKSLNRFVGNTKEMIEENETGNKFEFQDRDTNIRNHYKAYLKCKPKLTLELLRGHIGIFYWGVRYESKSNEIEYCHDDWLETASAIFRMTVSQIETQLKTFSKEMKQYATDNKMNEINCAYLPQEKCITIVEIESEQEEEEYEGKCITIAETESDEQDEQDNYQQEEEEEIDDDNKKKRIRRSHRIIESDENISPINVKNVTEILSNYFRINRLGQIHKNKLFDEIKANNIDITQNELENIVKYLHEQNKIFYIEPMVHQL